MTAVSGEGLPVPALVVVCGPDPVQQARYLFPRVVAVIGASNFREITCELQGAMDLGVVDALARMQLATRQYGVQLRLRCTDEHFCGLLELTGLAAFLSLA